MKFTYILFFLLFFSLPLVSANVIDFSEKYQDYQGIWHKYTGLNLVYFPMYVINENENNISFQRFRNFTTSSKNNYTSYIYYPDRIIPRYTFQNESELFQYRKGNSPNFFIESEFAASHIKSVSNDVIDMGEFKRTTSVNVIDANGTNYNITSSVVGNKIRFTFKSVDFENVIYPLTITENTIIVDNATTSGFTSSNVSFDGVRWTDSGQIAINLRNDSQLNMTGLVAYWSMDENTGTIVHQVNTESGLVNTTNQGTWNGNATLNYTTGRIGNALNFDGVNDYVNAGNNASLNITNTITIDGWINLNQLPASGSRYKIITNQDSSSPTHGYGMDIANDAGLYKYRYIVNNSVYTYTSSIPTNTWINLKIVANNTFVVFYINGILKSSVATVPIINSSANMIIGWYGTSSFYFNGSIDEVRIYNRALSASEVAVLYNTSMRTQGNLTIFNQSASAGNVINRTRVVYTGQDSLNNISIYSRQNGTTTWSLIQSNVTSNTWYSITNQFSISDFKVQLDGNGSNTPFFTNLEWDENPVIASTPTNLQNLTGNFFVNHSWSGTSTSYNVSVNGNWYNGTTNKFNYTVSSPHGWVNISVAGYLTVDGVSNLSSFISQNTQLPNNLPVPTIIHTTYLVDTGTTLNFTINSTDLDSDTLTYSSNNTIGTFDITTGNFSYTGNDLDTGSYTIYFTVNDGYGGTVTQITTITEQSVTQMLLALIQNLPTKDDVSNAGTLGLIGGILGGAMAVSILRRKIK